MTARRRLIAAGALAAIGISAPLAALAAGPEPVDGPVRSSVAGVGVGPDLDGIGGGSGQHLVCYAPGFAEYTICIDYPG